MARVVRGLTSASKALLLLCLASTQSCSGDTADREPANQACPAGRALYRNSCTLEEIAEFRKCIQHQAEEVGTEHSRRLGAEVDAVVGGVETLAEAREQLNVRYPVTTEAEQSKINDFCMQVVTSRLGQPAPVQAAFAAGTPNELLYTVRSAWLRTGLRVERGTHVVLSASGSMRPSRRRDLWTGPEGTYARRDWVNEYNVQPGAHCALLARVGDDRPFVVGPALEFDAPRGGELYLGVNDTDPDNNEGSFEVRIRVGR